MVAHVNGLDLPENLSFDQWQLVGTQLVTLQRAVSFLIGDWLAFGQKHYLDEKYSPRLQEGILARAAEVTGLEETTLANYKSVCARVERSRRREGLTIGQLTEIVSKVPPGQIDYWQDRAVKESLSRSKLREALRRAEARHRDDPVAPLQSFLTKIEEFTDWFTRDFDGWAEPAKEEASLKLKRVMEKTAPYLAKRVRAAAGK